MPTQQRFEGPTLEAVLDEVRAKVGEGAVISAANKLRKGGLGGFFARETYEVLVDVDVDEDDDEWIDLPPAAAAPTTEPAPPLAPMSLMELAESVSNEEARAALGSNPLEFDAVLNQVIRAEAPRAPRSRPLVAERVRDVTPEPEPEPITVAVPQAPAAPTREIEWPTPAVELERPVRRPVVATTRPARDAMALTELGVPDDLARRLPNVLDLEDSIATALQHLPRPEPLPMSAGSVIAVVGDRQTSLELANSIAKALGLSRESVFLASSAPRKTRTPQTNQLSSAQEAFDSRRSWRRRKTPTIVAIDCAVGRSATTWAERVLDALEPAMTWATIDACRKPEDIADWADRLGGVDALDVRNLHDTSSPAAVLRAGIPVGFIDGDEASPDTWARVLSERIAA